MQHLQLWWGRSWELKTQTTSPMIHASMPSTRQDINLAKNAMRLTTASHHREHGLGLRLLCGMVLASGAISDCGSEETVKIKSQALKGSYCEPSACRGQARSPRRIPHAHAHMRAHMIRGSCTAFALAGLVDIYSDVACMDYLRGSRSTGSQAPP
jgi:hypothetical protein